MTFPGGALFLLYTLGLGGISAEEVVATPEVPTAKASGPLRRSAFDPILAGRPEGAGIRAVRRTGRELDKRLRQS